MAVGEQSCSQYGPKCCYWEDKVMDDGDGQGTAGRYACITEEGRGWVDSGREIARAAHSRLYFTSILGAWSVAATWRPRLYQLWHHLTADRWLLLQN